MNTFTRILPIVCLAAFAGFAIEPSATLFDNDQVKVVRALEKAHVKGSFHEHKPNRVMVYLQPGRQRFEYQDGRQPVTFDWKTGQVVWSKPEGMHSPEVVSDDPFNIIEVELKKPGTSKTLSGPQDALKADPKHYSLEFENDQVRVLRLKLAAHESTPVVAHAVNRLTVYLTAAGTHKFGEAVWETPGSSKEENTGAAPAEMVLIEIKD